MKNTVTILTVLMLGACATSERFGSVDRCLWYDDKCVQEYENYIDNLSRMTPVERIQYFRARSEAHDAVSRMADPMVDWSNKTYSEPVRSPGEKSEMKVIILEDPSGFWSGKLK